MNLKKLITEGIVFDQFQDIESELASIQESIQKQLMIEGVDDPGILKCIFMAGGPGSGKSYTAMEVFGIDKTLKLSFSASGLKVSSSDTQFMQLLKKNGIDPRDLAKIEKEDSELWDKIAGGGDSIRNQAKELTKTQKSFYEAGRLGMIVDGTGHDYNKIKRLKDHAEALGYDCYMVFVNTSLDVAQQRNKQRDRELPEDVLADSWKACQENMGKFKGLFGGNFDIIDNTVYKPVDSQVIKAANQFIRMPIQNPIGKKWITTAKALKNANLIKK